jgi:hypothetical protein
MAVGFLMTSISIPLRLDHVIDWSTWWVLSPLFAAQGFVSHLNTDFDFGSVGYLLILSWLRVASKTEFVLMASAWGLFFGSFYFVELLSALKIESDRGYWVVALLPFFLRTCSFAFLPLQAPASLTDEVIGPLVVMWLRQWRLFRPTRTRIVASDIRSHFAEI